MFGRNDFRRAVRIVADRPGGWTVAVVTVHRYAFFPLEYVPHCQLALTNIMPDEGIPDEIASCDEESIPPYRIRPPMEYDCTLLTRFHPPLPPNA